MADKFRAPETAQVNDIVRHEGRLYLVTARIERPAEAPLFTLVELEPVVRFERQPVLIMRPAADVQIMDEVAVTWRA